MEFCFSTVFLVFLLFLIGLFVLFGAGGIYILGVVLFLSLVSFVFSSFFFRSFLLPVVLERVFTFFKAGSVIVFLRFFLISLLGLPFSYMSRCSSYAILQLRYLSAV